MPSASQITLMSLPDELISRIVHFAVRRDGVIEDHILGVGIPKANNVKVEVLAPFRNSPKLLAIAEKEYYNANTFGANTDRLRFFDRKDEEAHSTGLAIRDNVQERSNIRHLAFNLATTRTEQTRSIRMRKQLSHDPSIMPFTIGYAPSHWRATNQIPLVIAWEIGCKLTKIVQALRDLDAPSLRCKALVFQEGRRDYGEVEYIPIDGATEFDAGGGCEVDVTEILKHQKATISL